MKKTIGVLVALITISLGACGFNSTNADEVGLKYNGGPIEGETFDGIVGPGNGSVFHGISDTLKTLPTTVRRFTACADDLRNESISDDQAQEQGYDAPPIVTPAGGGGALAFCVTASFRLNTSQRVADGEDKSPLQQFYEDVCRKYGCDDDGDGWDAMLDEVVGGPIENRMRDVIIQHSVDELYAGVSEGQADPEAASVLTQVQDDLAASVGDAINSVAGGDYFCGPTFDRDEYDPTDASTCPPFEFLITDVLPVSDRVLESYEETAASAQRVTAAENDAQADVRRAEGQRQAAEILNSIENLEGYLSLQQIDAVRACAEHGNCTLFFSLGADAVTPVPTVNAG